MIDRAKPEIALAAVGAALAATLLGIGLASGEIVRHVVQAAPVILAAGLAYARPTLGRWVLGPVFGFWLLITAGIGLFLAGLPSPIDGTFNPAERALTGTLAVLSLAGLALFARIRRPLPIAIGALSALVALAAQVGAMALSLQPAIAHI